MDDVIVMRMWWDVNVTGVLVDTGILNRVEVANNVRAMEPEVIIMFVIITLDSVIANRESVVWLVIDVWMDTMDFRRKDVDVSFLFYKLKFFWESFDFFYFNAKTRKLGN